MVINTVIPYQEKILKDEIPGIEKSHAIENFKIAAGISDDKFYGNVYQDSDFAKWLEAVSNAIGISSSSELWQKASASFDLIAKAQDDDGYLHTFIQIEAPDKRWTDLQECHELYCMGHMIEAIVSYYEVTGDKNVLAIATRIADCIDRHFGESKSRGIPGHPEIELALMRLYHITKENRYLRLAQYFINERGSDPNFFAEEASKRDLFIWHMDPYDREYAQNDVPPRKASKAKGHAVRAVYLYTGMADIAASSNDQELFDACERIWNNIVNCQMYVTGSIGATANGEAFTTDYDLPNDTAYAETCAAIGMIFFTRKMLEIHPDGKYTDVMERILYNGMLSGMQHDGKKFFYVNPLEVDPRVDGKIDKYKHVLPQRPEWYATACCPPNVARLITSLSRYCWGENENTIYSHLFLGCDYESLKINGVKIHVDSEYPARGLVTYSLLENANNANFSLAIHIPHWAEDLQITLNGEAIKCQDAIVNGYCTITRHWVVGDVVSVSFNIQAKRIYANELVRQDAGQVAILRGPIVYCLEEEDNGKQLYNLSLPYQNKLMDHKVCDPVLGEYIGLTAQGLRQTSSSQGLYSDSRPQTTHQELHFIPYYLWGNRSRGEMRVWIREQ
jgi:DUF1680 family protein